VRGHGELDVYRLVRQGADAPHAFLIDGLEHLALQRQGEGIVILADGGGDLGSQPVDEQKGEVWMADGGGDLGGQAVEETRDIALV
jgi:hypothetical protein